LRRWLSLLTAVVFLAGCRAGTAPQELEQLRARASTLEAENAHARGQLSLAESERDQLKEQVNALATELARTQAGQGLDATGLSTAGQNLVILPRQVRPGEWVAVHIRNYPTRLLSQAGIALRGAGATNLAHISRLSSANVFLLPIPRSATPGSYQVVLGEAGALGPGAKLDDRVTIFIK